MAQPFVKVKDKDGKIEVTYHEGIGKATQVIRQVKLDSPTTEELRVAIKENLLELRVARGRTGRLAND